MAQLLSRPDFIKQLDIQLEKVFDSEAATFGTISADSQHLLGDMRRLIMRAGKRIRPYLFYLTYAGLGSPEDTFPWELAAAIELYHQFLLIHDDVIDHDLVRHGGPTVAGAYLQELETAVGSVERRTTISQAMAILAGDLCLSVVVNLVATGPLEDRQRLELMRTLHQITQREIAGQQLDVLADLRSITETSIDEILAMYSHKTSAYTFEMPFRWALILNSVSADQSTDLIEAGRLLGQAYQVTDDLIGLFSDTTTTGKPIGSDLREGKKTVIMRLAYEKLEPADWRQIEARLGKPSTEAQLTAVVELLRTQGIETATVALAEGQLSRARKLIKRVDLSPESRAVLEQIFAGLTTRRA